MRNQLIALAILSVTACQQSETKQTTQDTAAVTTDTTSMTATGTSKEALEAVMTAPEKVKAGAPIPVKFTVTNNSGKELQFCKWHTPFEGKFMNSFFEITDSKGEAVQYKGIMAKRVSPPPADAYMQVPAKQSVSAEIDLLTGYNITAPGVYKVVYQGSGVSGLNEVNELTITVE